MTEPLTDPMLVRVRKLLAKAENPGCSAAEAAALNDKAAELIAKYGIDRALAANAGLTRDEVGDRMLVIEDPYSRAKARFLVNVARPLRVRVVFNVGYSRGIKGFRVHMFGCKSDLDRVELLFTSLLVQASFGMACVRPEGDWWRDPTPSQIARHRRDWLAGFGVKIELRLREAEERAVQAARAGTTGTDLVLVSRTDAVNKAVELAYPDMGRDRGRQVGDENAYRAGARAGATADLGGTRLTRSHQRSISN